VKKKPDAPLLDLHHPALSEARPHFIDNRDGNTLDVALVRHLEARFGEIRGRFGDIPVFQWLGQR
jgi:hypothetical protein